MAHPTGIACMPCCYGPESPSGGVCGLVAVGMRLYSCCADGSVHRWDPAARKSSIAHTAPSPAQGLLFVQLKRRASCKDVLLLALGEAIHHVDVTQQPPCTRRVLRAHESTVRHMSPALRQERLWSVDDSARLVCSSLVSGAVQHSLELGDELGAVTGLCVQGEAVAVCAARAVLLVHPGGSIAQLAVPEGCTVAAIQFAPGGDLVGAGSDAAGMCCAVRWRCVEGLWAVGSVLCCRVPGTISCLTEATEEGAALYCGCTGGQLLRLQGASLSELSDGLGEAVHCVALLARKWLFAGCATGSVHRLNTQAQAPRVAAPLVHRVALQAVVECEVRGCAAQH
eukprot:TRINITY_DN5660_c0_g1_i2.p1 TRINITY_DN5660_c0_g1~~TRINITY_DN5660_c0_g1_i2.p1  ORF type:complete len:340 (-),score=81.01 TRINITY_DN5660_c0_g1_i2:1025-2044(-)